MNFNVPDKLYKLPILMGAILVGYGIYFGNTEEDKYISKVNEYNHFLDSIRISVFERNYKLQVLTKKSDIISRQYCVDNPIKERDSIISFTRKLSGTPNELIVNDSISAEWDKLEIHRYKIDLLKKKESLFSTKLDAAEKEKEASLDLSLKIYEIGFFLIFIGVTFWSYEEILKPSLKKKNKKLHKVVYPHCQSCGKRFSPVLKYGINRDKTDNYAFCANCYKNGFFIDKSLSYSDVVSEALEATKSKNRLYKWLLKRRLSNLERWRLNQY